MNLCDINDIKDLLARHGFHFSKSMGQNFLIASWVPEQIAEEAALSSNFGVLEIGPGIGPLTVQLAARAGKVISVELDKTLLPILDETLSEHPNVTVIPGDIMKLDLNTTLDEHLSGYTLAACANLPYNITTPVLTKLLESKRFSSITVMIQKEAAQRICAKPGMEDYGHFSVFCQYHANCEVLFDVPPSCFLPAPKVTSAILRMVPRNDPNVVASNEKLFFSIIKAAFAQRRKTLLNALSSSLGNRFDKEVIRQALLACDLPETVRGEKLTLSQFVRLANYLSAL